MLMEPYFIITNSIIFLALAVGTYTDIRTREVPDWINYSLIFSGFAILALHLIIFGDWIFFLSGLAGFIAFFIFALVMFYSGQWGGGDSKMIMGLGVLLGLDIRFLAPLAGFDLGPADFPFMISFLINILLIGAAYGFVWAMAMAIKNRKSFFKEVKKMMKNRNIIKAKWFFLFFILIYLILFFLIHDSVLRMALSGFVIAAVLTFHLWIFVRAVEKACMYKYVTPDKLTEGDWIAKPVKFNGRVICSQKDLGIKKNQIALLKRYRISKVLIKEGIPFVPSFLMAYLVSNYLLYHMPETLGNLILVWL